MKSYLAIGAVAAGATFVLTYLSRWLAARFNWVERSAANSMHDNPMPTVGGLGMYLAFLISMGVAALVPSFRPIFEASSEPLGIVLGATVIFVVGFVDDLWPLSPPAKMAGTVLAGGVLSILGVTMLFFRVPFDGVVVISADLAPLATVVWMAGMTTATNYIDGLDGLAAGIVAIASAAFFIYSTQLSDAGLLTPDNIGPLVAMITLGVCLGFLPHNFNPAKIIMGDEGALFLGLLMASSTLVVGGRTDDPFSGQNYFFYAPMLIPILIMGVPILDTAFSIVRRAASRSGVMARDKRHMHHRLIQLGHGPRRAVLILWAWTAILSAVALVPTFLDRSLQGAIPLGAAAMAVALYTYLHPSLRGPEEDPIRLRLVVEAQGDEDEASTR